MNKEVRDVYKKYTPEVVLKRVLKYAWKSRVIIFISLLFLLLFTILELFQPLLVQNLIDKQLNGVQTTYVADETGNISFRGNKYRVIKTDNIIDEEVFTLVYYEGKYYFLPGVVDKTEISSIPESSSLLANEIKTFYQPQFHNIEIILIIYGVLTILIIIFRYFQNIFFQSASMRLTYDLRCEAFDKLNKLPLSYFSVEPSGKIVTKINSDSEGVRGLYTVVFQIVSAVISLTLVFTALFLANYKVGLISLSITPLILIWMTVYRRVNNKYHHRIREMNSVINASMAQYVNGMEMIQLFNQENKIHDEYDELLKTNYNNKMRALKINSVFGAELLSLLQNLLIAFIIYFMCKQIFSSHVSITAGLLYVYITFVGRIMDPILTIFNNLNALEDSFVASSRIFDLLDQEEDKYIGKADGVSFKGKISFQNISFGYNLDSLVLKDISFDVNQGDFIGLVGHTGSGKSTLMTLLLRYYDFEDGKILIDDVDFMQYTKQEIRSNIGYVLQEPAIFEGTIKSNVKMNSDATDEDVKRVLSLIGANKFIDDYPDGINTKIEYLGSNLSSGEKQLISFARILLKDPAILVLDEATANIDTETEQLIQRALKILAENRTTFVVAHRLSTIKDANCIYVLDDGKIIEKGTHTELYNQNGKYRNMYDAQFDKKE